jgi:anti-sigma factor RsiW
MSCDRFEHMLSAYLEGDLSRDDETAVRAHVESCPSCARVLAEFRALEDTLLARREQVPSPEAFIQGVFTAGRTAEPVRAVSPALHRARLIMDAIFSVPGLAAVFMVAIGVMGFAYRDVVSTWIGRTLSLSSSTGTATSWLERFLSTYAADMTMVFIVYGVATALIVASGAWMTLRYLHDQ